MQRVVLRGIAASYEGLEARRISMHVSTAMVRRSTVCVRNVRGSAAREARSLPAFSSVRGRLECGSASVGARVIGALRRTNTHAITAQALRWPAPCINTMRVTFNVRLRQRSQSATRDHRARHNAVPRDASNKSATQQATQQHRTTASPRDHHGRTPFLFGAGGTLPAGHREELRTSR